MILYVNGDSHAAGAEAVNAYAFAEDDPALFYMGRAPHPANLAVSWARLLADTFKATLHCDAESASSNSRILRTTRKWVDRHENDWHRTLVVISWSTWERQEWLIDNTYYQINASGIDDVPESHQQQYKEFVASVNWQWATQQAHEDIWQLHQELEARSIHHVFFNGNNHFESIRDRRDWGTNYILPYDPKSTYSAILTDRGYQTVSPDSWHFGKDAHSFWKQFMLQYCIKHNLV
jgi:hypothetical protein